MKEEAKQTRKFGEDARLPVGERGEGKNSFSSMSLTQNESLANKDNLEKNVLTSKGKSGRINGGKWRPDLTRSQLLTLMERIRKDVKSSNRSVTDTANWMVTKIDGVEVFAIYSTENANDPTLLFESKGNATTKDIELLLYRKELESNGRKKSVFGRASTRNGNVSDRNGGFVPNTDSGRSQNSNTNIGERDASILRGYSPTGEQASYGRRALGNVLDNLFEAQERRDSVQRESRQTGRGSQEESQQRITESDRQTEESLQANDVVVSDGVASFTPERFNDLIKTYSTNSGNENYSKGYVAYISPSDFLALTTTNEELIVSQAKEQYNELDVSELASSRTTPFLKIDFNDKGKSVVVGHEGRHRMALLRDAGVNKVAIAIENSDEKNNAKKRNNVVVKGQSFGRSRAKGEVVIDEIVPLSLAYRDEVREKFVDNKSGVKFSKGLAPGMVDKLTKDDYSKLKKHFGTTQIFNVAGYLLVDGDMLDFSGKHWGAPYSTSRYVDHRDVWEVWENADTDGVSEMVKLIGNGNIRMLPECGGINLAVAPTEEQKSVLRRYINRFSRKEGIIVDYDAVGGDTIHSEIYEKGESAEKILQDIDDYFNGKTQSDIKAQSDIMRFHSSDDVKYSKGLPPIVYNQDVNGRLGRKKAESLTEEDLRFLLEKVQNGELDDKTYIPLRKSTPIFFRDVVHEHSDGRVRVLDVPLASTVEHLRQNMEEEGGASYGRARPHRLSIDDVVKVSEAMQDPSYIVLQRNGRYAMVVSFYDSKRKKNIVASIDFASNNGKKNNYKYREHMNGYEAGYYNIVVTQFEPDSLQKYLDKNTIVYNKKEMNGKYQVGSGRIVAVTHDIPFTDTNYTTQNQSSGGQVVNNSENDKSTIATDKKRSGGLPTSPNETTTDNTTDTNASNDSADIISSAIEGQATNFIDAILSTKKEMNGKYQVGSGRIVAVTHDIPFTDTNYTTQNQSSGGQVVNNSENDKSTTATDKKRSGGLPTSPNESTTDNTTDTNVSNDSADIISSAIKGQATNFIDAILSTKKEMNGKYQVGSGRIVAVTHDIPFTDTNYTTQNQSSGGQSVNEFENNSRKASKGLTHTFVQGNNKNTLPINPKRKPTTPQMPSSEESKQRSSAFVENAQTTHSKHKPNADEKQSDCYCFSSNFFALQALLLQLSQPQQPPLLFERKTITIATTTTSKAIIM